MPLVELGGMLREESDDERTKDPLCGLEKKNTRVRDHLSGAKFLTHRPAKRSAITLGQYWSAGRDNQNL
jgi:hypothetical protein